MSLLQSISKPGNRPIIATIVGDAGVGKTSLAAMFPKPVFMRAEDGLQAIDEAYRPDAFPVLHNGEDAFQQITALLHEPHDYQTLVVDSVTALHRLFEKDVLDMDQKAKGINQALGGYGNGMAAVAAMHARMRKGAHFLNTRKGMHVVFVAHAEIENMKLPDMDDYSRWSIRIPAKCQAPYIDDVDLVGFVRLRTILRGDEDDRKLAISTGDRELIVHANAATVTKNRYGITEPLPFLPGQNPLAGVIPGLQGPTAAPAPQGKRTAKATAQDTNAQEQI